MNTKCIMKNEHGVCEMRASTGCNWPRCEPPTGIVVAPPVAADSNAKATNPKDAIATNKLPLHLVSPIVKAYQAIAHFLGNVKYGAWNYRGAGVRYSIYKAALERHVDAWWECEEIDPNDGTPHLANALACLNILIEGKYTTSTIDDRPPSRADALRTIRSEFEALMPKIREQYKHMDPKHWTIADGTTVEVQS